MLNRYMTCIISVLFFVLSFLETQGQSERWYLLKSIQPLTDIEVKNIIANISEQTGLTAMWYNGAKTGTFGAKDDNEIDWIQVIQGLELHGYFLADITTGSVHHEGMNAATSLFYQEALYCSLHSEGCPANYSAKLNQDEWDALPEEAKLYYQASGHYLIAE